VILTFYGSLADRIGRTLTADAPADVRDVAGLKAWLASAYPQAATELLRPGTRAVIGDKIVSDAAPLDGAMAVELLPPVSGG
jgi:molybdopterin converting factor small subunit